MNSSNNDSATEVAAPVFELFTGYDNSLSAVRVLTIIIACVGILANMLLYFTCSPSESLHCPLWMTSSAAGFMKGMAVVDSLALFFTGILSVGLSTLQSVSINGSRGLCRLKGFAMWQTFLAVNLLLTLASADRAMALWMPSIWRKVGGSTRLAWLCVVFVEISIALVCGPFLSLHDVSMGLCLVMNMEVLSIGQIQTYLKFLIYFFVLTIPLFFNLISVILIGVSLCRGSPASSQERSNTWVQPKSLSVAHVLICVFVIVLDVVWLFVFRTAAEVTFVSHKNIMYRNLLLLITELIICIMTGTKFFFYFAVSPQFRKQFVAVFANNTFKNDNNINNINKNNSIKQEAHEMN